MNQTPDAGTPPKKTQRLAIRNRNNNGYRKRIPMTAAQQRVTQAIIPVQLVIHYVGVGEGKKEKLQRTLRGGLKQKVGKTKNEAHGPTWWILADSPGGPSTRKRTPHGAGNINNRGAPGWAKRVCVWAAGKWASYTYLWLTLISFPPAGESE